MKTIPAINCKDAGCVKERVWIAESFFSVNEKWIHLDIADDKFAKGASWNNPGVFAVLGTKLKAEVHLMVSDPESRMYSWLKAGAKRIIIHPETTDDPAHLARECEKYKAEAMLSVGPKTPMDSVISLQDFFQSFHILAVEPGPAGQKFQRNAVEKIKFLRRNIPDAIIEVDGGINLEIAKLVREAGADIVVAGSYIFESKNPAERFKELEAI